MHEYRLGKLEVAVVTKPSTVRYHTFQFLRVNVLESYTTQCWVVYTVQMRILPKEKEEKAMSFTPRVEAPCGTTYTE